MPKEKKEPFISENKKNIFFYEIIGIVLAMLSFFALAKLGTFGFYLHLTIKLIFGDWAFLFTILGIMIGTYFLLMHQKLPITSLRFIGIIIIFLSFAIISHFSMHDYVKQYTTNYLPTSLNLYFDYFKTGNSSSMIGGGLVGMALFYLLFYMLSTPGVIIICLGMVVLGICFITKRTVVDFSKFIFKIIKKLVIFMKNRGNKFKNLVNKINQEYNNNYRKKLPKNLINKKPLIEYTDSKDGDKISNDIKIILNKLNIFHYEVSYYLTPHLIVFEIKSLLDINLQKLESELIHSFQSPFLIKLNEEENIIMIEIINAELQKISLYQGILFSDKDSLFITIEDHNNVVLLNDKLKTILLISSSYQSILYYIILASINNNSKVIVIDFFNELNVIADYVDDYKDQNYLDQLIISIDEYDQEQILYLFINIDTSIKKVEEYINKIKYILQIAKNLNIYIVIMIDKYYHDDGRFYDLFSLIYTIDNKEKEVLKLFGFKTSEGLFIGNEGLLKWDDYVMRVANGYIDEKEIEKIMKK